ncbi:MAG: serine hydrolase domain-containing protein [Kiritimatiellia bacterium]|jgi:CubicO group peptidase (beta-lactamase class C family)
MSKPACPTSAMQRAVQEILDDAVASQAQSAVQCCVYLDGKPVVDAWAGTYEKGGTRRIDGDSLFPIFSTEKPVFVTAVHRAVELGKMDYDDRIASYWPEFAAHGMEKLTVREVLGHRTGLPGSPLPGTPDESVCDWAFMVAQCADMKPHLEPGTRAEYLGITYAWILGEPLARAMGKPIHDVLRELVLVPAGIGREFYFALDDEAIARCVTVYDGVEDYGFTQMNKECYRRACIPSAYAAASARGIAKFYLRLTGMDGLPPLIRPETLANALKPCRWEGEPVPEAAELDKTWQMVWGLGYGLWGGRDELGRIFGQGGLGGSEGLADLENRIVIGYTCSVSATACGKPYDLRPEIFRAVGIRTRYTK